jgi:integration host factor subunit alpha
MQGEPMATITKAHLVDNLLSENIFTKAESAQIIDTIFELMKKSLEAGDDVLVSGFGKFSVREKCERTGRNPQTGESMKLACRRVVTFRCSSVLREKMNEDGE